MSAQCRSSSITTNGLTAAASTKTRERASNTTSWSRERSSGPACPSRMAATSALANRSANGMAARPGTARSSWIRGARQIQNGGVRSASNARPSSTRTPRVDTHHRARPAGGLPAALLALEDEGRPTTRHRQGTAASNRDCSRCRPTNGKRRASPPVSVHDFVCHGHDPRPPELSLRRPRDGVKKPR